MNETSGMRVSFDMASPISEPPQKEVNIAPGKLFFSRTSATRFVTAMVTSGVVGAPFLKYVHYDKLALCSIKCVTHGKQNLSFSLVEKDRENKVFFFTPMVNG